MGTGWAGLYPRPDAQAVRAEGGAQPQVDQRESWGNTASFAGDSRLWDSLQGAESKESRRAWEIARPPSQAAGRSSGKWPFEWESFPSLPPNAQCGSWLETSY